VIPRFRTYVSLPVAANLQPAQQRIKAGILKRVESAGFDLQEFGVSGLPKGMAWNSETANQIMSRCHGAIIFAFSQWRDSSTSPPTVMPTDYCHFEGAVALAQNKETLIIKDEVVAVKGITYSGTGQYYLQIPSGATGAWLNTHQFRRHFDDWVDRTNRRHHIFFGYSGGATNTANNIIRYLHSISVKVRDWQMDFRPAAVILDEIEQAARSCLGGIFLFTADDDLASGDTFYAAPRDNVVFEAGYFMNAVGRERTLIIRETSAKMPADVGGGIYLPLADRNNTSTIEHDLRRFIETQL
jgi:hypothetical protein